METPTAEQFAQAVAATLDGVAHLYKEVDRLNEALLRGLMAEPVPFSFIGGTLLDPDRRADRLDRKIRDQYHFLLQAGGMEEELDDDPTEEDEEGDEAAGITLASDRIRRQQGTIRIDPASANLAVSVVLRDSARPQQPPHVRSMVLTGWGVGAHAKAPKDGPFRIAQWMMVRLLRGIDASGEVDLKRSVFTRAKVHGRTGRAGESQVSFRHGVQPRVVPLFDLQGVGAIDNLVQSIKAQWTQATVAAGPAVVPVPSP